MTKIDVIKIASRMEAVNLMYYQELQGSIQDIKFRLRKRKLMGDQHV